MSALFCVPKYVFSIDYSPQKYLALFPLENSSICPQNPLEVYSTLEPGAVGFKCFLLSFFLYPSVLLPACPSPSSPFLTFRSLPWDLQEEENSIPHVLLVLLLITFPLPPKLCLCCPSTSLFCPLLPFDIFTRFSFCPPGCKLLRISQFSLLHSVSFFPLGRCRAAPFPAFQKDAVRLHVFLLLSSLVNRWTRPALSGYANFARGNKFDMEFARRTGRRRRRMTGSWELKFWGGLGDEKRRGN